MTSIDPGSAIGPGQNETISTRLDGWEEERVYRAAFDNAPIGMALVDQGILIYTNQALVNMLGYDRAELEGMHFTEITHPEDIETSEEKVWELKHAAEETRALQFEKRYLHKEGHTVWARVSLASTRTTSDQVLQAVVQMEDITAQKLAEAEAGANAERFRLTFESAASGMALVDPESCRFLEVNQAGCRMLGYDENRLKELTFTELILPEDREESQARFASVLTGDEPFSQMKLRYRRSDETTASALVSAALVRDSSTGPLHMVINMVDITEEVEARGQLEAVIASKDELIASVSHELRTPLTAILGFVEILRGDGTPLAADERVSVVQSIADQTSDLANIVEDLLVTARADNDSLAVARVPVDLRAQASQVLETFGGDIDGLSVSLEGEHVRALGDPARVRQILRNLISNAFRYGGEHVRVATYTSEASACVAVMDDGPGVLPEEQDLIFEPYQRATNTECVDASIGLGLTVSRRLAQLMEGDLSYRFDEGWSTFELALTLAPG